jgi:hypothetical protein
MLKASDVNTSTVQPSDLGRAHKIICTTGNFYKVQSSRDELVEYSVRYDARKGFTCTCEAGLRAFSRCKDGCCQHVKIAVACEREVRGAIAELEAAIKEQAAPVLVIDGKPASAVEVERVMSAPVKPASRRAKAPESKPFSLLKV